MDLQAIDLANGEPSDDRLPSDLVTDAVNSLLSASRPFEASNSSHPLSYGNHTTFFSNSLLSFMISHHNRSPFDCRCIVPASGVSGALDLVSTMVGKMLATSSRFAFVEETTYDIGTKIIQDHDFTLISVPTDADGIIIEKFRELLMYHLRIDNQSSPTVRALLHIIPTFHNPTGRTMYIERRLELLQLTEEFGVVVVADEVYQWMDFPQLPPGFEDSDLSAPLPLPPSFAEIAKTHDFKLVISVSSFTKIFSAGIRVGWIEFSNHTTWIDAYWSTGLIASGSCPSQFTSCIMAELMSSSFYEPQFYAYINNVKVSLARKCHALTTALLKYSTELLADGYQLQIEGVSGVNKFQHVGGYFVWVRFPFDSLDGSAVIDLVTFAQEKFNVKYKPGYRCCIPSQQAESHGDLKCWARLCFGRLSESELEEGAKRLVQFVQHVVHNVLNK